MIELIFLYSSNLEFLNVKRVNSNNLHVSHTGGRLSSDSGLALVDEFMDAFHFTEHSKDVVSFNEDRRYWLHDNHKILKQLLFQIIAGYKADFSIELRNKRSKISRHSIKQ